MEGRNTSVFGIYTAQRLVNDGIARLKSAGFGDSHIALLTPETPGVRDLAVAKSSKLPEGGLLGDVLGGIAGALIGWALYAGGVEIPGIGGLAGYILAGGAVVGVCGMIIGALAGLRVPEYEVRRHEGRVRQGGILVSVHCESAEMVKRAKQAMRDTGALRIASAAEAKADFGTPTSGPARMAGGGPAAAA